MEERAENLRSMLSSPSFLQFCSPRMYIFLTEDKRDIPLCHFD